jgi:uncharacterized protein DUF2183
VSRDSAPPLRPAPIVPSAVTYRWDLDKTYLRTEFESLRKMVRIPFETASDKIHFPGVPQLLRALRRSASAANRQSYVYFLSASPPQIGAAIREKLELDGIEYDGITFKDQLRNLIRGRWRGLREQVGYKLGELLAARIVGPAADREILFGDDWESDPLIYSLYADIVAGRLSRDRVIEILQAVGVERGATARVGGLAEAFGDGQGDVVERIYINLERRTPPGRFRLFGPRLVPAFNYFQTGASLVEGGWLDAESLPEIAAVLIAESGYTGERLRNSLDDLVRRGHLRLTTHGTLLRALRRAGVVVPGPREALLRARLKAAIERWRKRRVATSAPEALDYGRIVRDAAATSHSG